MSIALTGGTVIDGISPEPRANCPVLIESDRITGVARRARRGATDLDVTGLTVLPGLIDLHSHLGVLSPLAQSDLSPAMIAALLFRNAERCLMSGHTTAREVAGADGALREVIDQGVVPGPRLFPSGPLLCQTGGHGDMGAPFYPLISSHHHSGIPGLAHVSVVCDGPDQVRIAARDAFRRGATQLKLCITGGAVSLTDRLEDTQFSVQEMRAAVEEADARGTYVTAHAHNSRAIQMALEAGLQCIEHGTYLDEETVAAMAAKGVALVPTLTVARIAADNADEWGIPGEMLSRLAGVEQAMTASLKLAYDAGVTVGSGTDIWGPDQKRRGLEIALKATALDPMAAIMSATSVNADILRRPDLGRITEGAIADVIAVSGDPLAEPDLFDDPDRVVLILKGGEIVKDLRG